MAAGLLFAGMVLLASGCKDKCKNPKQYSEQTERGLREGPAVQCNAVVVCQYGGSTRRNELKGLEDPVIVDCRSDDENRRICAAAVKERQGTNDKHCDIEVSPAMICLDAAGTPDGSGPDVSGTTGGTLVTVGVGTGDYYFEGEGAGGAGGTGGAGGAGERGEEPGEGGQGGM